MEEKIREMMEDAFTKFHIDSTGEVKEATPAECELLDKMYAELIPAIIDVVKQG